MMDDGCWMLDDGSFAGPYFNGLSIKCYYGYLIKRTEAACASPDQLADPSLPPYHVH